MAANARRLAELKQLRERVTKLDHEAHVLRAKLADREAKLAEIDKTAGSKK